MNKTGASNLAIITTALAIIGAYGGLLFFLVSTDKINYDTYDLNIKLIYFLISLLFGALIILYVIILNKPSSLGGKRK